MTISAGIDIGSTYAKAVLMDGGRRLLARAMRPTGFKLAEVARTVFNEALAALGLAAEAAASSFQPSCQGCCSAGLAGPGLGVGRPPGETK